MIPNDAGFASELAELREQGLQRRLPSAEGPSLANWSSNDYLGLARHPAVVAAATEALRLEGAGGTSSRLLAGTFASHRALEEKLAAFFRKEAALVYASGYHMNTGVLPALAGPRDAVFVDRLSHASLIDGIKLSGARLCAYDHNDMDDLEVALRRHRGGRRRAFIATESIFSMDGDAPPFRRLADLAQRWGALLYVDEAHAVGLFGEDGRGAAEAAGALDGVDILAGTLSKSLGTQGGFVAASREIVDLLITRSRSFIYTTALAPACAAAALASLNLLPSLSDRRRTVLGAAEELRRGLSAQGYSCLSSVSQIVPVLIGGVEATAKLSKHLFDRGFFVPSIRPPTVPSGQGRLRLSVTHDMATRGVKDLLDAFAQGERIVKAR